MSKPSNNTNPAPQPSILIVEDSMVVRELLTILIRNAGFTVTGLSTLANCFTHIKSNRPDLIVLDEQLPDGRSSAHLDRIRGYAENVPIIFVSGELDLTTALAISQQGAAAIFKKPVNPKALIAKIQELTEGFQRRLPAGKPSTLSLLLRESVPQTDSNSEFFAWQHLPGTSAAHAAFGKKLLKVRDFRSQLLMLGVEGCAFIPAVCDLQRNSIHHASPLLIYMPGLFHIEELLPRLDQHVLTEQTITVVLKRIDTYTPEQIALLEKLLAAAQEFAPYAGRLRLILSALPGILEDPPVPPLPPALIERLATLSIEVPTFKMLQQDRVIVTRRLIESMGGSASILTPEAIHWIETHPWPGDYRQFRRVILVAAAAALDTSLSTGLLETAYALEPTIPQEVYEPILPGLPNTQTPAPQNIYANPEPEPTATPVPAPTIVEPARKADANRSPASPVPPPPQPPPPPPPPRHPPPTFPPPPRSIQTTPPPAPPTPSPPPPPGLIPIGIRPTV